MNTSHVTSKLVYPGYETVVILKSELAPEAVQSLIDKLGQVVKTHQGEWVLSEDWGKRKLAYPIEKETRGHYSYCVYSGDAGVVAEIERQLRIHDHVLRYLTVRVSDALDPSLFLKNRAEELEKKQRLEREKEARRHLSHSEGSSDSSGEGSPRGRHSSLSESSPSFEEGDSSES